LIAGQAIALVLPNGPDFVTTVLASTGLGACALLDPLLTQDEFEKFFGRLRAPVLLTLEGFETAAVLAARNAGMRVLHLRFRPDYFLDSLTSEGVSTLRDVRVADACLLLFTSATTGRSKLIPLTTANLGGQWACNTRALQLHDRDIFLSLVPMFNLFGLGGVFTQIYNGGAVVCIPEFDPNRLSGWANQFRPTWISFNSVWLSSLADIVRQSPDFWKDSALRFVRSAGSVPDIKIFDDLQKLLGVPILESYGMTEAGGIAHSTLVRRKPSSVGQTSGTEIAIFDAAQKFLPSEEEGEVVLRGPNIMSGYLEDDDANRAAFTSDGWFRTGDLGKLDSEGFLFLTGRIKEIINRGGSKIIPQELEGILLEYPEVADAAVFAVPHRTLGEEIAAAVVLRSIQDGALEHPVSERRLRDFVSQHAAAYKVPRHILFVEKLPRGATGRVQRGKLSEQFREVAFRTPVAPLPAPDPYTASRVVVLWKRILNIDNVGLNDSFYDLGGDSLSAAMMIAEVRREFNIGPQLLDRVEFFDHPTPTTLAHLIVDTQAMFPASRAELSDPSGGGECRILTLNAAGSLPPLYFFPASDLDPYYFRHLAKELGQDQPGFVACPPISVEGRRRLTVEEIAARTVRAIQARHPRGPYALVGHCFGGVIAVETARQLRAEGSEVPKLILVDALTPGYPKILASTGRYVEQGLEAGRAVLRGRLLFSPGEIAAHVRRLAFLALRGITARRHQKKLARGEDVVKQETSTQVLLNRDAATEYSVPEIDIPIVHFMARDHKVDSRVLSDPRFGWRDFASAGLEERWMPGDHNSIVMNENAAGLAAELRKALGTSTLAAAR
jgi:acyl-CoA synthetase (AMP-forming)/AMP-acid ligase II/thioesterase domain-containing protein